MGKSKALNESTTATNVHFLILKSCVLLSPELMRQACCHYCRISKYRKRKKPMRYLCWYCRHFLFLLCFVFPRSPFHFLFFRKFTPPYFFASFSFSSLCRPQRTSLAFVLLWWRFSLFLPFSFDSEIEFLSTFSFPFRCFFFCTFPDLGSQLVHRAPTAIASLALSPT